MAIAAELPPQLVVQATDRLGLTIFFALVMHSLIILGISFSQPDQLKTEEKLPGLDVTLVQSKTDKEIEDADFMAQENQMGNGTDVKSERASSPVEPLVASGRVGEVTEIVTQIFVPEASEKRDKELLTADKSEQKMLSDADSKELNSTSHEKVTPQILTLREKQAMQSAEIEKLRENYRQHKNFPYLGAHTKKSQTARYEEMFRKEIERIGNQNFPDAAKRNRMAGNVRVLVRIKKDGTLDQVKITKSSYKRILDDAALRFVKMAKFPPIPNSVVGSNDGVTIVRTFQFIPGGTGKLKTHAN